MPELSVKCYKGTNPGDDRLYMFDPLLKLSEVRKRLTNDGFLPPDNNDDRAFRFIAAQSESSDMQDALINKSIESVVPLQGVLGKQNQLLTTNYLARKKPDLIGIGTDWFFNRYLGVQIDLNNSDPEGRATNDRIKAFKPLMLTNVKPTSENVTGIWDNVCVCVEDSVVTFKLSSWGAAGYQFHIGGEQGEPIVNGGELNCCLWNNPNTYSQVWMQRYSNKPQTIQIVSARSQQITGGDILRFQKVTVKSWRITGYSQDGHRYESNQTPPTRSGPAGLAGFNAEIADAASDFANQKQMVKAKSITTVPGDSVTPGGPVAGPPSVQQWGKPIYDIQADDPSQALGEVVIYFFVFESWDKANKVIHGYNAPDPNLWN